MDILLQQLEDAGSIAELPDSWVRDILVILEAERMAVFQLAEDGSEIASCFDSTASAGEVRLRASHGSPVGHVAATGETLVIADCYDQEALSAVHPELAFDYACDQDAERVTQALMALPIKRGAETLGALEVCNCTSRESGNEFTADHVARAQELARVLAGKFPGRDAARGREEAGPFAPLLRDGSVTQEQWDRLARVARTGRASLGRLLVGMAGVPVERVGACLEQFYDVPFVQYDPNLRIDRVLLDELNRTYLARQRWVPLRKTRDSAIVLIDDPADGRRTPEIQTILDVPHCEFRVGLLEDILYFINPEIIEIEQEAKGSDVSLEDLVGRLHEGRAGKVTSTLETTELADGNAPAVVQLVNRLIGEAIESGASDIHIEPCEGHTPSAVRIRVDGICRPILELPASRNRAVVARIKVMSNLDITESRVPQDGKMSVKKGGKLYELRVATLPTVHGENAVLRVLSQGGALSLDKLNLTQRNSEALDDLLLRPHGIFLVVGPTGSGKTTTLHAILGHINTPERKIWTAEDPVEITQRGLQQMQMNAAVGLDFPAALRAFLRADPDVILIGEMRDYETAHSGIEASLTGHLVFSTLHTNSAPETVTRLLDIGLDPINFADALIGVLAQRLVRRLCPECKESYTPDAEELELLVNAYGAERFPELGVEPGEIRLCRPVGCEACMKAGYKGRTGIHELLVASKSLKRLVTRKKPAADILALGLDEGMRTLRQDGIIKVLRGETDFTQVRTATVE